VSKDELQQLKEDFSSSEKSRHVQAIKKVLNMYNVGTDISSYYSLVVCCAPLVHFSRVVYGLAVVWWTNGQAL